MTEDQASKCWCPMIQHVSANNEVWQTNRNAGVEGIYCLASECAMWVWDEALDKDEDGKEFGGTNYDTEGHCGLINK